MDKILKISVNGKLVESIFSDESGTFSLEGLELEDEPRRTFRTVGEVAVYLAGYFSPATVSITIDKRPRELAKYKVSFLTNGATVSYSLWRVFDVETAGFCYVLSNSSTIEEDTEKFSSYLSAETALSDWAARQITRCSAALPSSCSGVSVTFSRP